MNSDCSSNLREKIGIWIGEALESSISKGLLPAVELDDIPVERPQSPEHGHFASSLPLKLARDMRMNPVKIAEALASCITGDVAIGKVWVQSPGFINFSLEESWIVKQVDVIRGLGDVYGNLDLGAGQNVQVEFVSVNPTGPLHVGHARGAIYGSALANILETAGYAVQREYYVNDAGNQMSLFFESLFARYCQLFKEDIPIPEDGYRGEYMIGLAKEIRDKEQDRFLNLPKKEAIRGIGNIGLDKMLNVIKNDLAKVGVWFDNWFSEKSLYEEGQYDKSMDLLRLKGFITERDGAIWFTSTSLGEDKDNVLVRSTGVPTYFASDVAYHYNKFIERKFDRVINVWGADHQGHISRMKAVMTAIDRSPDKLTLTITQIVTFKRGDETVKISKRSGDIITLSELVSEVGPDACRFFFLSRSPESQMEFDMKLAMDQSSDNPVYYIQYAYARISSIIRLASERDIDYTEGDVNLLTHDAALSLITKMLELPEIIGMMAHNLEPHHLTHYSTELATAFHWFYRECRVISSETGDEEITKARLKLVDASKVVLGKCLQLMNMNAPDEM